MTNGLEMKKAPVGFSWTTALFGPFPALFRQHWSWGIGIAIGNLALYGLVGLVCAFFYNKIYIKSLFSKGYWVHDFGGLPVDVLKAQLGYIQFPKTAPSSFNPTATF
jgi:hypothetical protein